MTTSPTVLDSDFRYIDKNGILLKSRTELSISQMLNFLGLKYEYNHELIVDNQTFLVNFKTENGLIVVIDKEEDIEKYKMMKKLQPDLKIMAIGHPKYAAQIRELQEIVFFVIKHNFL